MDTNGKLKKILSWMIGNIAGEIFIRILSAGVTSFVVVWKLYTPNLSEGLANTDISFYIAITGMFFGFFVISLIIVALIIHGIKKLYKFVYAKTIKAKEAQASEFSKIGISISPLTNKSQVILTVKNDYSYELKNCHAKIVHINLRRFRNNNKNEKESFPVTNQKLEWYSTESKDGFISIRQDAQEDLSLAWTKDFNTVWDQIEEGYEKFGFSYIPRKPQNLDEGYYYVTVRIEGDIQEKAKTKTVWAEKKLQLGFFLESHTRGFDNTSIVPVIRLYEKETKLSLDQFRQPFEIRQTKSMFVNELWNFAKQGKSNLEVLSDPVMLLLKRRSDMERAISQRGDKWYIVQDVRQVDAVKLSIEPYRGLLLEILEKEVGLWIVVIAEGDRDTIDELRGDSGWMNKGTRFIGVNEKAHLNLLKWLESLEEVKDE
ncbi:MAG: hypothetical protein IPP66_02540 [Anaerolineales bacterium]|nr:hypothetical protein [Anaerolineales bacterium]